MLRYNSESVELPAGGFLLFGGGGSGFSMTPSGGRFDGAAWVDVSPRPLASCSAASWSALFVPDADERRCMGRSRRNLRRSPSISRAEPGRAGRYLPAAPRSRESVRPRRSEVVCSHERRRHRVSGERVRRDLRSSKRYLDRGSRGGPRGNGGRGKYLQRVGVDRG